ncbi:TIGR03557 family F420-dependent LLM class oxidoreductase [Rhodopila sp.]|uniref:TIGR03557 family F420-dependent LLM class oxidoreductase n=1 Tax=Rhodopila sp. TaxID=2480087 RepID=UPI003D0A82BF
MLSDHSATPHTLIDPAPPDPDRRNLLKWTSMLAGASGLGLATAQAQPGAPGRPTPAPNHHGQAQGPGPLRKGMFAYTLAHEQFPVPEIVQLGGLASRSGFNALATSDHFQPWQSDQGHAGEAWVTMGALGAHAPHSWMGTAVTCPTLRYRPAVVAETWATLSHLYPGRVFLGVGSGEALNEQAATGEWPKWQERWDRLIEAMAIIRQLWTGQEVSHKGTYYTVNGKLFDPPAKPIPLLTAANGKKSMRLAGQYGDGLITDPMSWQKYKTEWEAGAQAAGKNTADMPVMLEHYVVVGDEAAAKQAAQLWRFGVKAWHNLFDVPSPERIQQRADAETPLDQVMKTWAIGTDPAVHIAAAQKLFESGVTIVNIHSGQPDQKRVIDFYAEHVLPRFPQPV